MPRIATFFFILLAASCFMSCSDKKVKEDNAIPETSEVFAEERKNPEESTSADLDTLGQVVEYSDKGIKTEQATNYKNPPEKQVQVSKPKKKRVIYLPEITFDSVVHKLPEVNEGDRFKHQFHFINTGKAPLSITNVKATCGCTRPNFPFLDIAPGDSGVIDVTYDAYDKRGQQEPELTVIANTKPKTTVLRMMFNVNEVVESKDSTTIPGG